jgi:hypothetical protein
MTDYVPDTSVMLILRDTVLVHKDPEFKPLAIRQEVLPLKAPQNQR